MKTINDFNPGDVLLFYNNGFIPKAIRFFMRIYNKKKKLPERKMYYNHVAVVVNLWGNLFIAESNKEGVTVNDTLERYVNNKNVLHLTWKKPLSKEESDHFSKTAIGYSLRVTRYDFINFFDQIYYILTGKWRGKTGEKSRKRQYCSELAAVCMDETRGSFNGETWNKNPLDIELCEDLIDYDTSKISKQV
jgi:hypothetical protein